MVEPNYRIKKAFLAAPGQVQLQVLKDELRQRQIEPVTSYESPAMGTSILEHIERAIRKTDLFIAGALTSEVQHGNPGTPYLFLAFLKPAGVTGGC